MVKPNRQGCTNKSSPLILPNLPILISLRPTGIKKELAKITRKFLWQGGKDNEKKFHMVNWAITCAPKENGGLGIRDPEKINLALGAKVIWRIITGGKEWWKKALCSKYMTTNRKRCVEEVDLGKAGSPIWKLIRASIPLIQTRLNWDPGNGKNIKIWEDNYSESGILSKIPSLNQFKHWLSSEGRSTLFDISNWHPNNNWKSWNLGEVPPLLREEAKQFLQKISGSAPVHLSKKDDRSWGKEGYTVKSGYKQLLEDNGIPPKSTIWKEIWNPNSLPKINIFAGNWPTKNS
jgi:hypothetical protein